MPTVTMTARLSLVLAGDYSVADSEFGAAAKPYIRNFVDSLASGNQADQCNRLYTTVPGTLASTGGTTYDLSGGLTDIFGNTIAMTALCGLLLVNKSTTAGEYLIMGNATNPVVSLFGAGTHTLIVPEDGLEFRWAPKTAFAVTAGTGDGIKIASAAGTPEYALALIGRA